MSCQLILLAKAKSASKGGKKEITANSASKKKKKGAKISSKNIKKGASGSGKKKAGASKY
jgi:hypothetical protein